MTQPLLDVSDAAISTRADRIEMLRCFEEHLDPARPTASEEPVEIIGYGEVSTVFSLAVLPGVVCKRMAGFRNTAAVEHYVEVVRRYIALLEAHGVRVAETTPVHIHTPASGDVVYLLQPQLDATGLGHHLLREAGDTVLLACITRVLENVRTLLLANRAPADGRTLTVDAQLSNWHFPVQGDAVGPPVLIDVGMPYMRHNGEDELGIDLYLAPVPRPLHWYYRRARIVEQYLDDYFEPRKIILDLLGNFYKEGRPERIAPALDLVNRWLAGPAADLGAGAIAAAEVEAYYRRDAQLLELFLKLRRLDRFVRTRLLRRRYNFILPGPIRR